MRVFSWNNLFVAILATALSQPVASAQPIETTATHAVVMDHATQTTLYEKNAHEVMYPASMTKMMTSYMIFEALRSGDLQLSDTYKVSEAAWRKGGSKMFVKLGSDVSIEDLMRGIVIQSGNDACIVFAEGFAGSEERFAERMTKKARDIGMRNTTFKNATGWPDEAHVTTAYDLALLAGRLVQEFPQYYDVYAEREFRYNGITQQNRNLLLSRDIGVDGLKTGHTEAAGYGITISGKQEDRRVHVVVGGLSSEKERAAEALKLYRYAYAEFAHVKPGQEQRIVAALPIWYGARNELPVTLRPDATIVAATVEQEKMDAVITYDNALQAPVEAGAVVGTLKISHPYMSDQQVDIIAAETMPEASFIKTLSDNLQSLF